MATYANGITGKAINGKYWEFIKISINIEKLKQHQNDKGWVNLLMNKRKEVGKYWETHSFTLDEKSPKEDWARDNWCWEVPDDLWF